MWPGGVKRRLREWSDSRYSRRDECGSSSLLVLRRPVVGLAAVCGSRTAEKCRRRHRWCGNCGRVLPVQVTKRFACGHDVWLDPDARWTSVDSRPGAVGRPPGGQVVSTPN